jgi:hypothetical protein
MRDNHLVPENESTTQQGTTAASPTEPSAAPTRPEAPRAPLPGEPGFKAPLTKGQLKRMNQTVKGMIISVVLTIAVVIPVILLNPGSTKDTYENRIDAAQIAQQTVTTQGFKAIAPDFPKHYYANKAQWNPGAADGIGYWELGVVGKLDGQDHYVKILQAQKVNASWIALATDGSVPTGKAVTVGATTWQQRQKPGSDDGDTILTTKLDGYTFILTGDHGDDAFLKKAASLVKDASDKAKPAV